LEGEERFGGWGDRGSGRGRGGDGGIGGILDTWKV